MDLDAWADGALDENGDLSAELAEIHASTGGEDVTPEDAEPEAALVFGSSDEWLREWLLKAWQPHVPPSARPDGTDTTGAAYNWCARWWLHPEAVNRIEALWRAWEQLRTDPMTGPSVWWRDHFDHHWPRLVQSAGVFAYCTASLHRDAPTWAAIASPAHVSAHSPQA